MKIFNKQNLSSGVKSGLTVLISVLIIFTVVKGGTITPPSGGGEPSAKFYTISEIYNFIASNTPATEGAHSFTFSDNLEGTGRTLTEIYNALAGLISANQVKKDTIYLGKTGTLVPSGGDASPDYVLSGKTFFGGSQGDWNLQTGSMANNSSFGLICGASNQAVTAGYYSGGNLPGDVDLIAGNIKSGANIFGVSGNSNVVNTSSGDAIAGNILTGKKAWVAGLEITGSVAAGANVSGSNSLLSFNIPDGLYSGSKTCTASDTNLVATNIASGVDIFGVSGTLLKNLYNGTSRFGSLVTVTLNAGGSGYTNGAQVLTVVQTNGSLGTVNVTVSGGTVISVDSIVEAGVGYIVANSLATTGGGGTLAKVNITAISSDYPINTGGVDDYNDDGTMPADSYAAIWTTCNVGNNYCDTGAINATNADKKDNSTGLVWSIRTGTSSWFSANNCKYPNQLLGDDGACGTHGEIACKCVKQSAGSMTGCETLGAAVAGNSGGWRLPSQKELMQAYINGSWGNLSSAGYFFWSATTTSHTTFSAWYTYLGTGPTDTTTKTSTTVSVRCVR
ncbi:MAG: DUF1566 domain-containing protein [bacterium]|nr:DUF1566 domain-containing protein [bacterium]